MPELPEVETILRSMKPALEGQYITSIEVKRPDLRTPFPPGLSTIPLHKTVIQLRRRAKYILIDFQHGWSLLIHLGMSGRLFIDPASQNIPPRRHEHLVIWTNNGHRIGLVDPRRFGMVCLFPTDQEAQQPQLKHLGVEPLLNTFTPERLATLCATTRMPIKNALLDQRKVVGLGNIYVCEALFKARIHPAKAAADLTRKEIRRLHGFVREILQAAIAAGGSTLRDYVRTDGQPGAFQELHLVYGREGEECPVCRSENRHSVIMRIAQSGRSTFFCPHCQKNPHK
ncbi:bifunctional DNA-formamidopyrimidine glycosylase/DNA-(apurinic or apyrimidinic site) lyase [Bombella sp. TMW 2.2543]|uniref:Formamidopyrimidine-DNA glycosylase n=1 Tax=Bombella pluederhausensis TaxID=2967336 RepID=A0ABT3WH69_9PROT|nr:bifunctional DNA-formamidopyrimidine glycosylase/DNA-(apurinic or apyrimidinic site) lyase [Bombella pluederhausensis]MCX5617689.1 bifunctional DNA-formamidopyrimidine glycosylase/DNA-(apurinic or apyrimidinic site) lyase [Bombella pluederhausensis]